MHVIRLAIIHQTGMAQINRRMWSCDRARRQRNNALHAREEKGGARIVSLMDRNAMQTDVGGKYSRWSEFQLAFVEDGENTDKERERERSLSSDEQAEWDENSRKDNETFIGLVWWWTSGFQRDMLIRRRKTQLKVISYFLGLGMPHTESSLSKSYSMGLEIARRWFSRPVWFNDRWLKVMESRDL